MSTCLFVGPKGPVRSGCSASFEKVQRSQTVPQQCAFKQLHFQTLAKEQAANVPTVMCKLRLLTSSVGLNESRFEQIIFAVWCSLLATLDIRPSSGAVDSNSQYLRSILVNSLTTQLWFKVQKYRAAHAAQITSWICRATMLIESINGLKWVWLVIRKSARQPSSSTCWSTVWSHLSSTLCCMWGSRALLSC